MIPKGEMAVSDLQVSKDFMLCSSRGGKTKNIFFQSNYLCIKTKVDILKNFYCYCFSKRV